MLSFTPMACIDGLHPHLAQQMADAREFHQSKVMVFHPKEGESCSVPAKDRRNAWTLGGIAIDQVSKYKYLGVVYQEDGSWQAHAQRRLQRCKQPMGTGGHCCHAVCRQRSDYGSDLHLFRGHVWRGSVTTKAVKDKMSAVVKLSAAF
jgi:hypothetical protein